MPSVLPRVVPSAASKRGLSQKEWCARFAAEAARLRLHYCDLFKFWRDCRIKRCKRHRRCCGDTNECLKRRIDEIPRMAQFQARQAVIVATPKNIGRAEREARQLMPYDVIAPDPPNDAMDFASCPAIAGKGDHAKRGGRGV